jgi:single-strand selective monofunctional uracil DNA glycosylase
MADTWTDDLVAALRPLRFAPPVTHVYNPLEYARASWDLYMERFGQGRREILLLGMNPGPFGMAQTGVPFGDVAMARDWLGIEAPVGRPAVENPKRPVLGFDCTRSEVSGSRLWGFCRDTWGTPERFFERFFLANYCPLVFMEASGRNVTPDKLPAAERTALFAACDEALRRIADELKPRLVLGIGKFAEQRARAVLGERDLQIGCILHPSPANPQANRGWGEVVRRQLESFGVEMPPA